MIALSLTDVKECMSKLLLSETFDPFLFIEGEIMTFGTFAMDGYLKKDFYEEGYHGHAAVGRAGGDLPQLPALRPGRHPAQCGLWCGQSGGRDYVYR